VGLWLNYAFGVGPYRDLGRKRCASANSPDDGAPENMGALRP
jgi:hypothetical protein